MKTSTTTQTVILALFSLISLSLSAQDVIADNFVNTSSPTSSSGGITTTVSATDGYNFFATFESDKVSVNGSSLMEITFSTEVNPVTFNLDYRPNGNDGFFIIHGLDQNSTVFFEVLTANTGSTGTFSQTIDLSSYTDFYINKIRLEFRRASGVSATGETELSNIGFNISPTLTAFNSVLETLDEDTEVEITLAEILAASNASDLDGSVAGFKMSSQNLGTYKIGSSSANATSYSSGSNDVINHTEIFTRDVNSHSVHTGKFHIDWISISKVIKNFR